MKKLLIAFLFLLILSGPAGPAAASDAGGSGLQLPQVGSETAVLMDADTGQVLYQKDMDKMMYPASITKVMTGMLALRYGELSDIVTMSDDAVSSVERDSSNIALSPGEQLPLEDALYALAIASANDAANGIAELIGGSMDEFAAMMNSAAEEAGAVNTHFTNANGLPDDAHYTTARDMALITAQALKTPGFSAFFNTRRYKIPPTNIQPETRIINSSNRFLNGAIDYEGTVMSKAGWTTQAEHTLVTVARRDGTTLIAVVMKAADSTVKWTDTTALLDYGFDQFDRVTITKDSILGAAPDSFDITGMSGLVIDPDTYAAGDVSLLLPKTASPEDVLISFGDPQLDTDGSRAEIPVSLSIPAGDAANAPQALIKTTVRAALKSAVAAAGPAAAEPAAKPGFLKIAVTALLSLAGVLLLAFVFLLIRRAVILRRRKRRRQERLKAGRSAWK